MQSPRSTLDLGRYFPNTPSHLTSHVDRMISMKTRERTISISEFKAKCLGLLEELDNDGIVVTKRGHPIAKVIPIGEPDNRKLIGSMKGKIKVDGNIFSTGVEWDAESRHTHARSRTGTEAYSKMRPNRSWITRIRLEIQFGARPRDLQGDRDDRQMQVPTARYPKSPGPKFGSGRLS